MIRETLTASIGFTIAFAGTTLLTLGLGGSGLFAGYVPDLTPVAFFFFALCKPEKLSITLTFVLGICADLLYGRTVGIGACALLLVAESTRVWQSWFGNRLFFPDLVIFVAVTTMHASMIWLLDMLILVGQPPFTDVLWQVLGCMIVYPACHLLLCHSVRMHDKHQDDWPDR